MSQQARVRADARTERAGAIGLVIAHRQGNALRKTAGPRREWFRVRFLDGWEGWFEGNEIDPLPAAVSSPGGPDEVAAEGHREFAEEQRWLSESNLGAYEAATGADEGQDAA